jgi:hypothetical protein
MTIWYILCSFGASFPILVSCTKKNLATPSASLVGVITKRVFDCAQMACNLYMCRSLSAKYLLPTTKQFYFLHIPIWRMGLH